MNGVQIHADVFKRLTSHCGKGNEYKQSLAELIDVDNNTLLSTAEHIAPFNTPSTISFVYPQMLLQEIGLTPKAKIVLLAGSLIPLDNADYPRGFFLPGNSGLKKVNVFTQNDLKMSPLLLGSANINFNTPHAFDNYPFIKNAFLIPHETYAHQLGYIMQQISQRWFDTRPTINVYPLEHIAVQLLQKLVESNDGMICQILFNKFIRNNIIDELFNVFCAWGNHKGSVLFWGVNESGKLFPFDISSDGNSLVDRSGSVTLILNKDCIIENLSNRQIVPGVYLSLLATSYLPNLPIAGGRKQFYYYRHMISATNKWLNQNRSQELSVFGYDRTVHINDNYISRYGTGLNLINKPLDLERRQKALEDCLIHQPLDVYYD